MYLATQDSELEPDELSVGKSTCDQSSSTSRLVELSRRYSNHVHQTIALVKTLERVRAQPTPTTGASVSATLGRNEHPTTGRAKVDPRTAATLYLDGSTLIELADLYGVSTSTIKRVLHSEGTRKYQRTP